MNSGCKKTLLHHEETLLGDTLTARRYHICHFEGLLAPYLSSLAFVHLIHQLQQPFLCSRFHIFVLDNCFPQRRVLACKSGVLGSNSLKQPSELSEKFGSCAQRRLVALHICKDKNTCFVTLCNPFSDTPAPACSDFIIPPVFDLRRAGCFFASVAFPSGTDEFPVDLLVSSACEVVLRAWPVTDEALPSLTECVRPATTG